MVLELLELVKNLILDVVEVQRPLAAWILRYFQCDVFGRELDVDLNQDGRVWTGLMVSVRLDPHVEVIQIRLRVCCLRTSRRWVLCFKNVLTRFLILLLHCNDLGQRQVLRINIWLECCRSLLVLRILLQLLQRRDESFHLLHKVQIGALVLRWLYSALRRSEHLI